MSSTGHQKYRTRRGGGVSLTPIADAEPSNSDDDDDNGDDVDDGNDDFTLPDTGARYSLSVAMFSFAVCKPPGPACSVSSRAGGG